MCFLPALFIPILVGLFTETADSNLSALPGAEVVAVNDNRVAAGLLRDGVLTVRLEVRAGMWHPDGENQPGVEVLAFGEVGGALRVPGPLIRVSEGTEIRVTVSNTLSDTPLVMHGLYTRGTTGNVQDTVHIAPSTVRELRFKAGAPGTYYYWASTTDTTLIARRGRESQLSGALIVDPRGRPAPADRVFVLGLWSDAPLVQFDPSQVIRFVINGRSWPHTERLSYMQGDTVRWRMVNPNGQVHPMHLHGFYFRVDSRGNERGDTIYGPDTPPYMVVTERIAPTNTASITWIPERPGNWLFHCHDNVHIQRQLPFDGKPPVALEKHISNHTTEMMQGLVMGVHVSARAGAAATAPESGPRRRLRLVVQPDAGGTTAEPSFRFALHDDAGAPRSSTGSAGPTIVVKRGEPVGISVVNELAEATAVHWHGIELDSYYDGVADFSGQTGRIAPAIAPRDSFEARFTPPRAGTFIYHTHVDEVRQQRAGLAGALLVVDPASPFDPGKDIVLLLSTPRAEADQGQVALNGSISPAPLELRAGVRYRLRLINIHTFRPSIRLELRQGTQLLTWKALAKDGADVPAVRATVRPAVQQLSNGETYDFEFTPAASGDMRINVLSFTNVLLVTMQVHVR